MEEWRENLNKRSLGNRITSAVNCYTYDEFVFISNGLNPMPVYWMEIFIFLITF